MNNLTSTDFGERLKTLIFKMGKNQSSFASSVGVSHTAIGKIVKGETQPRFSLIDSILKAYPEVSRDWLLEGTGEMFINKPTITPTTPEAYLQDYLKRLEERFEKLSEQLTVKDRQIDRLMDLLGKPSDVVEEAQIVALWKESQARA